MSASARWKHGLAFAAILGAMTITSAPRTAMADPELRSARGTPVIDGRLEETAWSAAPASEAFRQRQPDTGRRGTHRARVRVLYDDDAIYVGVDCETRSRPQARLARRDNVPPGEWVRVLIDARGEGASSFAFLLNPAGVQADAVIAGDSDQDSAWDAVWEGETTIHARGWAAEFRIPWRVLRFDSRNPDVRVQVERNDFDLGELTALVPIPTDAPRYVARFARVLGVRDVHAGRVFEFRPYVLGRARPVADPTRLDPTPLISGALGVDLKFGLTNDLVADLTLNPDFGQVEVDPTVINLAPFEVFFPERRPFFLEGADLFRTPMRLLHTRRIGASPGIPSPVHPGGTIDAVDPRATIWGATRWTGRIGSVSVGLLEAVTAPVRAQESFMAPGGTLQHDGFDAWPAVNWLAARVRVPVGRGSNVGALVTHVGRLTQPHDVVGAVDWDWRAPDGIHRISGQVAGSHAWNASQGVHAGGAIQVDVARAEDPAVVWLLRARALSRDFDPNGLGYLERADQYQLMFDITWRTRQQSGWIRRGWFNPWIWRNGNTAGDTTSAGIAAEVGVQAQNQWSAALGGEVHPPRIDDRETRGSIGWGRTFGGEVWSRIDTDPRAPFRASLSAWLSWANGGRNGTTALTLTWMPLSSISLQWTGSARSIVNLPRWVANLTDEGGRLHPVFGSQRGVIVESTLRAALAFTRRLSLDVFSQLLWGGIRYSGYTELVAPDAYVPIRYETPADYDRVALTLNAIARWEYRPGAFITAVFLHRQSLSASPSTDGFEQGLGALTRAPPDDLVLLKLTYLVM